MALDASRFIPVHTGNIIAPLKPASLPAVYPCAYREHFTPRLTDIRAAFKIQCNRIIKLWHTRNALTNNILFIIFSRVIVSTHSRAKAAENVIAI